MYANIEKIKNVINEKGLTGQAVISIDGPCGGGKTTLANEIEKNFAYKPDFIGKIKHVKIYILKNAFICYN